MRGIYAIYKTKGPTSHDTIKEIKNITGIKKVGHGGTLDPLAEGVLVVAVGREFTKKLGALLEEEKEYLAKIKLGENSTTDDGEGIKTAIKNKVTPTKNQIIKATERFIGWIDQLPPQYSAGKVFGERAYKKARRGEKFKLGTHRVLIKKIDLIKYQWPYVDLRVVTGSGVYLRSLARDMGKALKTGGYLAKLVRTRVGKFNIQKAKTVTEFKKATKAVEKTGRTKTKKYKQV